jgi:rhodanese-related sulfurtransferase
MRARILGGLVLLSVLGFWSWALAATQTLTVDQARELVQTRGGKADFAVLDVRTPLEFGEGHLPGAVNLDIQGQDFDSRLQALDRDKSYVVYCRTGNRSILAVRAMEQLGFQSILHMPQGIVRWQERGFQVSKAN